jgi:hypothetical protein
MICVMKTYAVPDSLEVIVVTPLEHALIVAALRFYSNSVGVDDACADYTDVATCNGLYPLPNEDSVGMIADNMLNGNCVHYQTST